MGLIDVAKVLGYGVIGLGFLLSFMSYRLLSAEQRKPHPIERMLKAIKEYMYFSVALVVLGGVFLLAERFAPRTGGTVDSTSVSVNRGPAQVALSESIGSELRDVKLVDGAATIAVTGNSRGVHSTKAKLYACVRYDEPEWWCRKAAVATDGTWTTNLYPGSSKSPFEDGASIRLRAIVDSDGIQPDEFSDTAIDRFSVRSVEKAVTVFLKKD